MSLALQQRIAGESKGSRQSRWDRARVSLVLPIGVIVAVAIVCVVVAVLTSAQRADDVSFNREQWLIRQAITDKSIRVLRQSKVAAKPATIDHPRRIPAGLAVRRLGASAPTYFQHDVVVVVYGFDQNDIHQLGGDTRVSPPTREVRAERVAAIDRRAAARPRWSSSRPARGHGSTRVWYTRDGVPASSDEFFRTDDVCGRSGDRHSYAYLSFGNALATDPTLRQHRSTKRRRATIAATLQISQNLDTKLKATLREWLRPQHRADSDPKAIRSRVSPGRRNNPAPRSLERRPVHRRRPCRLRPARPFVHALHAPHRGRDRRRRIRLRLWPCTIRFAACPTASSSASGSKR